VNATARRKIDSPRELFALFAIALFAIALAFMLVLVPRATPASTPLLALGPITVANGTAVLAGTVGSQAAGDTLTVNGQPLGIDAGGHFAGTVNVGGASSVELALTSPGGDEQTAFTIPLMGSLSEVIPGDVLSALDHAGVTLLGPITGGGDEPFTVSGSVLDRGQLAGLTLNGTDLLSTLGEGGSFRVQVPGTTKTITITATDTHGVSQTVVTRTPLTGSTVSAAEALGVRIATIRYVAKGVVRTHRMRMIVTVRDSRGLLIQGAKIIVRGTKAGRLTRHPRTAVSGKQGRATVFLSLRRAAFGKRLFTVTVASTPSAKAKKTTSVRIPRSRRHA
jgi:hypothetical protein